MKQPITPLLMFSGERHGKAEEAIAFYTSTFPESRIIFVQKYGPGQHEPEGTVQLASLILNGTEFMAMDSAMAHQFNFTPSISFFLTVESLEEFDAIAVRLAEGGELPMPPDNYGFSRKFAWINDRYGVSWQINWP